jgi:hypothetical protein
MDFLENIEKGTEIKNTGRNDDSYLFPVFLFSLWKIKSFGLS